MNLFERVGFGESQRLVVGRSKVLGIDLRQPPQLRWLYMKPLELKVARIGNLRCIRIPAATLERYRISASVVMEERSDGILLRPPGAANAKLSWEVTAREMAVAAEDWSEWDATAADGIEVAPWGSVRGRLWRGSALNKEDRRSRLRTGRTS